MPAKMYERAARASRFLSKRREMIMRRMNPMMMMTTRRRKRNLEVHRMMMTTKMRRKKQVLKYPHVHDVRHDVQLTRKKKLSLHRQPKIFEEVVGVHLINL